MIRAITARVSKPPASPFISAPEKELAVQYAEQALSRLGYECKRIFPTVLYQTDNLVLAGTNNAGAIFARVVASNRTGAKACRLFYSELDRAVDLCHQQVRATHLHSPDRSARWVLVVVSLALGKVFIFDSDYLASIGFSSPLTRLPYSCASSSHDIPVVEIHEQEQVAGNLRNGSKLEEGELVRLKVRLPSGYRGVCAVKSHYGEVVDLILPDGGKAVVCRHELSKVRRSS
jgi:hypothetical protein